MPTAEELSQMVVPTPAPTVPPPSTTPTPGLALANPPEPRFSYNALNTSNIAGISQLITINGQVLLSQTILFYLKFYRFISDLGTKLC